MTPTRKDKSMTTPFRIENALHDKLKQISEELAEHLWIAARGRDWIGNVIDVDHVEIVLDEWMDKHFHGIVDDKIRALEKEQDEEIEKERREIEETDRDARLWSIGSCK